jgi:hypothetical protein
VSRPKKLSLTRIYANCTQKGECKLWKGALTVRGQPYVYDPEKHLARKNGGAKNAASSARRIVWKLKTGSDPSGLIRMKCGNALCLEHGHMVESTKSEIVLLCQNLHSIARVVSRTVNLAKTGQAKLDAEKAAEIRRILELYGKGGLNPERKKLIAELAEKYGVKPDAINRVRSGLRWPEKSAPILPSSIWAVAANEERRAA